MNIPVACVKVLCSDMDRRVWHTTAGMAARRLAILERVDAYHGGDDETPYLTIPIRSDKLALKVAVREHVHHSKTDYQTIDIYDTHVFGKVLLLDGHVQLTEFDEHAYHEALVHI